MITETNFARERDHVQPHMTCSVAFATWRTRLLLFPVVDLKRSLGLRSLCFIFFMKLSAFPDLLPVRHPTSEARMDYSNPTTR
jgi:hypothetical protein